MTYEFDCDEPRPRRFLSVVDIVGVPDPIPPEFTYLVCIPEDGILYFHSGFYTFDTADECAMILNGVVIKINLQGIIKQEEESNGRKEEPSASQE